MRIVKGDKFISHKLVKVERIMNGLFDVLVDSEK